MVGGRTLGNRTAYFKRPAARIRPELDVMHTPLTSYLRGGLQSLFGDLIFISEWRKLLCVIANKVE
jgi:hypothetical protein